MFISRTQADEPPLPARAGSGVGPTASTSWSGRTAPARPPCSRRPRWCCRALRSATTNVQRRHEPRPGPPAGGDASSTRQPGRTVLAAAAYSRDGERRLTADGAPLDDAGRWKELLPVRTFAPDDLRLIKGSPRRRREYLDSLAAPALPRVSRDAPPLRRGPLPAELPAADLARGPAGPGVRALGGPSGPDRPAGGGLARRRARRVSSAPSSGRTRSSPASRPRTCGWSTARTWPTWTRRPTGPGWPRAGRPTGSAPTPTWARTATTCG